MIAVIGAITVVSLLVAAAFAATDSDLNLTSRNLKVQRAYAAAQAGIGGYSFHLGRDNGYWTKCTAVPAPNAVNQQGSTANRLPVQGFADASYAIELLPATGSSACDPNSPPFYGMLEQSGSGGGTFRIRSTGFVGGTQRSIVATYKRAAFLDYVYFTQLETSDPVTYGFPNPSAALTGAYSQCGKFRRDGRESAPIPNSGGRDCDRIVFVDQDNIRGPLHTNDDLAICGSPDFGRDSTDVIEVSAPPQGWIDGGCAGNANPNFIGPFTTNAPILTPPATNGSLRTIAGPSYTYTGQTTITLNGTTITVNGSSVAPPPNGVIYVANAACSTSYTPFTATYPAISGCGNAIVHGDYSGQLTIAAENDIVVDGSITRDPSSNGMLGLIANNFVRIKHPICPSNDLGCSGGTISAETGKGNCNGGVNGTGSLSNPQIDAANLSINHSVIVDHYDCGGVLGTLQVNGTITQKYRGAVGTVGGTGYFKDYNYDDRLRHQEPPHFLDPVQAAWHVQRETLDTP